MNILVIGNGFDLAHGLPTKYTDFLDFCKMVMNVYTVDQRDTGDNEKMELIWNELDLNPSYNLDGLKELFYVLNSHRIREEKSDKMDDTICYENIATNTYYDEFYDKIKNNIWIDYFLQCNIYQKENWIDFENEISKVIQSVNYNMSEVGVNAIVEKLSDPFLSRYFLDSEERRKVQNILQEYGADIFVVPPKEKISYKNLIARLKHDLDKLIRALEIYLCEYVEKMHIKKKSPDIDKLEIDKVLSFNYTNTFSKLYTIVIEKAEEYRDSYEYIHGKADIFNTIETNNMVLGIDEFLSDDRKDKDIDFIAFKKYYQRIYKQVGGKYKNWLQEIQRKYSIALQNEADYMNMMKTAYNKKDQVGMLNLYIANMFNKQTKKEIHNLYIFGHSLDITDKDILRDVILNDNVKTTIFYLNKDVMGQQIANLVKVIGQDELIRRTGGSTKTIEFKLQQNMIPI